MALTRPEKFTDNGLWGLSNDPLRDKCLNIYEFKCIEKAIRLIEAWRCEMTGKNPFGTT